MESSSERMNEDQDRPQYLARQEVKGNIMFDEIRNSYPRIIDENTCDDFEFFMQLPDDYRQFLSATNGGFVEAFRYTFLTGVPFRTEYVDNPSRDDCPVEFYGIPVNEQIDESPNDLLQEMVDHEAEEFLPKGVIAIARCFQNSLVCISLREEDRGWIYYWDWYWRHEWCRPFFDERIKRAYQPYPDYRAILNDPEHPLYESLLDDLNYATLTLVAPSFRKWFESCTDKRQEEEE